MVKLSDFSTEVERKIFEPQVMGSNLVIDQQCVNT